MDGLMEKEVPPQKRFRLSPDGEGGGGGGG